ncbi:hypothetical protein MM440_06040 [Arsenicicoccus piscis]|uniref:DUF5668 domain-containing protein n=1 Tax=Arsenicicoccus piscis TaxID=673954 RepID=A0ABQ6HV03_9MICO|nr:hypothetical protein [Arsenicicoccus piscis]MCH8627354.1 hypothetical protein [Arsenicicoccus piscis]GMA21502.1 hypothetical protein GCM10025862_35230 [Arsenicicoccus piscis]GMA22179.1 hypothetical protein GCM10025862_42020 [Arsenicicoccus piscis]GMA22227.1 hypothetical protein GCM10025862_42500 [Arsenicicoccus piscis]
MNTISSPAAQTTTTQTAAADARCHRRSVRAGLWLIAIGALIIGDALRVNIPQQLWGVLLFLPLAGALVATWREYSQSRSIGGHLWWIFGTLFPAAAGVSILTHRAIDYSFIVAAGFIAFGLATLLRRR